MQRGIITDDTDNQEKQSEDNSKPHKYRHYRCSKCAKDKEKSSHENEIQHALELQEQFERETQKGLTEAAVNAALSSDEVYDSVKGLIIDPFANSTAVNSSAVSARKLRVRM
jgi:membrane protein involved in colicin uptake